MSVHYNKHEIAEMLTSLGLNQDEANLYLFLLENGPHTPLEISRDTELNRTKIYRLVEIMTAKKLVEEVNSSGGKKIKAASPENLELLLKSEEERILANKERLPGLISHLSSLSSVLPGKFEVKHYKGVDGLKQMLWNELKSQEVLMYGFSTINEFVGQSYGDKMREEAVLRKVQYREIGNTPQDTSFSYNNAQGWDSVFQYRKLDEKIFVIKQDLQIYNDTVSLMNWANGEYAGVEIVSKEFAEMQRKIFWYFWDAAQ